MRSNKVSTLKVHILPYMLVCAALHLMWCIWNQLFLTLQFDCLLDMGEMLLSTYLLLLVHVINQEVNRDVLREVWNS